MEGDVVDFLELDVTLFISIHSLRMEGDVTHVKVYFVNISISIHSLRMEGDFVVFKEEKHEKHFNPLPPHGGRLLTWQQKNNLKIFQSTPSAWRETRKMRHYGCDFLFQSTPSAWRETTYNGDDYAGIAFQSTPSAWRETLIWNYCATQKRISIHSLRMEGD